MNRLLQHLEILFAIESDTLSYLSENKVFYQWQSGQYLDMKGKEVDIDDDISDDEDSYEERLDDPEAIEDIGEGFYIFGKEYGVDCDGLFGELGIKNSYGKSIVDMKYSRVGRFDHGYCSIAASTDGGDRWGLIDAEGNEIIPCQYCEELHFNRYGISYGEDSLIDINNNVLPDTELNSVTGISWEDRYVSFYKYSDEEIEKIAQCGRADNPRIHIYDTLCRQYVAKDIEEFRINISGENINPSMILMGIELLDEYETVEVCNDDIFICRKGQKCTIMRYVG